MEKCVVGFGQEIVLYTLVNINYTISIQQYIFPTMVDNMIIDNK